MSANSTEMYSMQCYNVICLIQRNQTEIKKWNIVQNVLHCIWKSDLCCFRRTLPEGSCWFSHFRWNTFMLWFRFTVYVMTLTAPYYSISFTVALSWCFFFYLDLWLSQISAASLGAQPQFISSLTTTPIITSAMSNVAGLTSQIITNAQGQVRGAELQHIGIGLFMTGAYPVCTFPFK